MELSKRLEGILNMLQEGDVPADIGTDHGFVPIEAVRRGIVQKAYAMDVVPGPLFRARQHIQEAGLSDRVEIRLSNGFSALKDGEANAAVIAGMGGGLIEKILTEGTHVMPSMNALILSPHSEPARVRKWLRENGFCIVREDMIEEERKNYPLIRAEKLNQTKNGSEIKPDISAFSSEKQWVRCQDQFGPLLLMNRNSVLKAYLEKQLRVTERILDSLSRQKGEAAETRSKELKQLEEDLRACLTLWEQKP